jgi:EmrB/QacA subfamily drug resistance transporter
MLPVGALGDKFGRKKVMLISLALFGLGSAACAFSPSSAAFIASRVVLGIAGAGVIVMALSALTVLFTQEERPRAVGVWAAANFLALPVGPILGGWLLSSYWWGWVFLMNVPVAVVGLIAAFALVPESRAAKPPGLDLVGLGTSIIGLGALTYGLIDAGQNGWESPRALALIGFGIVILVVFLLWERRLTAAPNGQPLLDMTLFDSASFTWGVLLAAVAVLAMIGVLFAMPQYFQGVLSADAMGSGLRLLPLIAGLVVGGVRAEWVVRMVGAKVTAAAGFLILGLGLLVGSTTTLQSTELFVALWMAVVGAGMGLAMATTASVALSELSDDRAGVGSAVLQSLNKVGGPFGAAILGSIVSSVYVSHLRLAGLPAPAATAVRQSVFGGVAVARKLGSATLLRSVRLAFVGGIDRALLVSAGVAAAGMILALIFLPRTGSTGEQSVSSPGDVPAQRVAEKEPAIAAGR